MMRRPDEEHDEAYHAPHPFSLGGNTEVLAFYRHLNGTVYVTAELTGKPGASYADYELMICHRTRGKWGQTRISSFERILRSNDEIRV